MGFCSRCDSSGLALLMGIALIIFDVQVVKIKILSPQT